MTASLGAGPLGYLVRDSSWLPADDRWLTSAERRWPAGRRAPKRIAEWRLGRWTAKEAVSAWLARCGRSRPAGLEVLAAADGAPEAFAAGQPLALSLSLSHSHGRALAVVGPPGVALGCDLERIEPRSSAFVDSYFTAAETAALHAAAGAERDLLANLLWSAKESALKALRRGLRADTRSVEVRAAPPVAGEWSGLEVTAAGDGAPFVGFWRRLDDLVLTIVSRPPAGAIVDLGRAGGSRTTTDGAPLAGKVRP